MRSNATWGRRQPAVAPEAPVFILGGRGAERLASLLGDHPRLCRVPRSDLLSGLFEVVEANQASLVRYGMPDQYWRSAVARFFGGLQDDHAAREGKARWVECVSSPHLTLGRLDTYFPRAQFIRVVERPSVAARRRLRTERRAGARLAPGRHLEVRHADLMTHPELCLYRVAEFLGEPWTGSHATPPVIDLSDTGVFR